MGLTLAKIRECCDVLEPQIAGKFCMVVHPKAYYALKVVCARAKYKHEHWVRRWEKWSGKKYIEVEGEFGILN